ncbi:MAG: hypothetical protein ABWZ40_15085 [Caulobacterales bacterium]
MSINGLAVGAGMFGIDVSSIQANAESLLAAAQAKKDAKSAVTTPWSSAGQRLAASSETLVRNALAGRSAILGSQTMQSVTARDAQGLFKLYNGLQALSALAEKAALKTTSDFERSQLNDAFAKAVSEAQTYVDKIDLDRVTLVKGDKLTKEDSALVLSKNSNEYVTGVVQDGAFEDPVATLAGNVKFDMSLTTFGVTNNISLDLSEMGATPRTMQNVVDYINGKLQASGAVARFSAVRVGTPNASGRVEADTFGFKITTISTEKVTFSAPTTAPALVIAGRTGNGTTADARLTKITDLAGTPSEVFAQTLNPDKGAVTWRSTAVAPDGGYYAVGDTTVSLDGTALKSAKDAILAKYDSAGKLLWTKTLGAADDATAYSLAVSDDGDVAIAGATSGRLTDAVKGGTDSFVTLIDASGNEVWTKQTGTVSDDKATAIAFDASGNVVVAGSTKGSMVSGTQQGGWDNYVESFDATGALVSRQQFGTSGDDSIGAIAIADDGQVIIGSTENGRGVLHKFSITPPVSGTPTWTQDLGEVGVGGGVYALTYENGAIYVGGRTSNASFDAAQGGAASGGAEDGFLARYDDGASPAKAWGTFMASSGDDAVRSITVDNGTVYATGDTTGAIGGATKVGTQDVFVATINGSSGAVNTAMQFSGGAGYASAASVAIDTQGDSILDVLGLPRGRLNVPRPAEITARSSVRVGDSFYVTVNGGSKRRVVIEKGDDWSDLSFKINAIIGLNGRAAVRSTSSGSSLRVEAKGNSLIEFSSGPSGQDALGALGLKLGTVFNDPALLATTTSSSAPSVIALGLDSSWSLLKSADAAKARDALVTVERRVRNAYDATLRDPNADTTKKPGKAGGAVPAYLQAQLANYNAALYRLQSGGSSTSSAASLLTG